MSEPKFTKGPWKCTKTQDYYNLGVTEHYYDLYEIKDENNKIITKLDAEGMEKDKNIKENAALIAAAPELYDFAHFFETFAGQCYCKILGEAGQKIYDEAVKICKKARGEE